MHKATIRATCPPPLEFAHEAARHTLRIHSLGHRAAVHIIAETPGRPGFHLLSPAYKSEAAAETAWREGWPVHTRMSAARLIRAALAAGLFERVVNE